MLTVEEWMDVQRLFKQGYSARAIARLTGYSRNTVAKLLDQAAPAPFQKPPRASQLDPFKPYLLQRFQECPLSAVRLLEEVRPMGYTGSLCVLRRFLAGLRTQHQAQAKATVRFETPPGQQAQADWAYAGKLADAAGQLRQVYIFTFVLGYSRMLFVRFTTSMSLATLIDCHQQAFAYLGGWPRVILYDNMKQVKLGPGRWNEAFLDFARHYGFTPKTHRPYRPRTKGKVERMVDYVKDNFLLGRTFADLDDLNGLGRAWLDQTANVRIHGTTQQRPVDLWPQEGLTPSGSMTEYRFLDPVRRSVSMEALVHYQGSRYSVPPAYAGQSVEVAACGGQIVIRTADTVIAEHRQAAQLGQCVVAREHLAELWKITCEQIKPPSDKPMSLTAAPEVLRLDLRSFEEVLL